MYACARVYICVVASCEALYLVCMHEYIYIYCYIHINIYIYLYVRVCVCLFLLSLSVPEMTNNHENEQC